MGRETDGRLGRKVWMGDANMEAGRNPMGKEDITVSILAAVYRPNLKWLKELFFSIKRQLFQDYEVIVMDDGSGQAAFQGIKQTAAGVFGAAGGITLLKSSKNEGSNRTFEKLSRLARGRYLAFCDQDDIWEADKLLRLVEAVQRPGAVMAYSDMSVIDGRGRVIYKSMRDMRKGIRFVSGTGLAAAYVMENCTAACSMLVQAEYVRAAMPFYKEVYCDQWVAACLSTFGRVEFVDKPLVKYRRHGDNQTGRFYGIESKEDYYRLRVLPACRLAGYMRKRGFHYEQEDEVLAFSQARVRRDLVKIWKYRKYNKKYAYFDMLVICLPDAWADIIFQCLQERRPAAAAGVHPQKHRRRKRAALPGKDHAAWQR